MSGSRQSLLLQAAAAASGGGPNSNFSSSSSIDVLLSPKSTEALKQNTAMNKVMGILGGSGSGGSGTGTVLGHVLTTSLAPVDEGGRQWRITTRKVAERRKPNVAAQPVLSEHPWKRHSLDLYDALAHLHILHFFREMPREVAIELLRWAVMKSYAAGDTVASPRPEDDDQMLQVIVSGSATAMVYPAGPKGKLEKNTSTFGSLATLLAKKEGEGSDGSSETQNKGSVRFLLEGACLGEMHTLATCVTHKEEVVALEPLVVLCVSHRYFIHAFQFVVASGEEGVCGIAQWLRHINCDKAPRAAGDVVVEGGQKVNDGKQASAAANAKKSARAIAPHNTWKRLGKAAHDYQHLAEAEVHVEEEAHHLDTLRCPTRETKNEKIMAQRCSEHKQKLKRLLSTSPVMRNAIDVADITSALRNLAWPFACPDDEESKKQQPMLASVSRRAILQHFKQGDVIYKEGESADFTYLLLDGEVRLSRSPELQLPEEDSSVLDEPESPARPSPKAFLRMRCKSIIKRQATAAPSPRVAISTPNWNKVKAVNMAIGAFGIKRRPTYPPLESPSAASPKSVFKTPVSKLKLKGSKSVKRNASIHVASPNGERAKMSLIGEEDQWGPSPRHGAAKLRETLRRNTFRSIVSNNQEKDSKRNRKFRKGLSFKVTEEVPKKDKVPQASFALSDMMAALKKREAEEAKREAQRQEELRREEEEREEAEQQSGLGTVIGPGGYRQVCLLGEEALVPPSLANGHRSEQHMLHRASTVTAKTDCTVVILDTLGWVEEGGLGATLAAPCPPSLKPLESFFLRYVALEAQSTGCCTPEALKAANELEAASGKKRNPWVEAWDDPEGREVPVSAVRKMCRGLPNLHAVRAIEKLPGMLQTLSGPFRDTLIPRMKYRTFLAGTPIDQMVVEADGQPPELVAFILRGTLQLDVFEDEHAGETGSANWNLVRNRSLRISKKILDVKQGNESAEEQMKIAETYHRTAWFSAGSMLDSWMMREEHKVARLMTLSEDDNSLPLVAEVHCSTDCELLLFSYQGYSLARQLSGPMLGLRPEKARRARAVLYTPPAQRTSPQVALLGEVLQQAPLLRAMRPTAVVSIAMGLTHRISIKVSHALQDIIETSATEPHELVAKLADDTQLNGKSFKAKKIGDSVRRRASADDADDDDGNGMRGYALAVVLSGAVQEIRSQHRRVDADDGGFCVGPGSQASSPAKESLGKGSAIETTSISISHGPAKVICDVRSVVMDLEPRRINAWAEMYTELALLRKYDYKAVKAVKEDHKEFLKKHINFITSTSDAFEDLDEEELLEIIPFLEFKTFPKNTMVARKGQKLEHLYINYKGTTTTRHNFGGVIMEVATHGKTTILGRASVFLDLPEEYDEVATSSNVELLAVPKNIILGTSSKFIQKMTKGAEDEQKFFARQVEKKLGLMELLGTHHPAAVGLIQRSAGTTAPMQRPNLLGDATCDDEIGNIVQKLKGSEAVGDENSSNEKDKDMVDVPNPTWSDEPEVSQSSMNSPANLKSSSPPKGRLSASKRPVSAAQSQGRAWRRSDSDSGESPKEGKLRKPRGTIVGGRHLLSSSMPSLPPDAALHRRPGSSTLVARRSTTQLSPRSKPANSRLSSSRASTSLCPSGPAMVANAVFAAREQVDEEVRLRHRGLNPYTLPNHRASLDSTMSALLRPGASQSSSGRLLSKAIKTQEEHIKPVNLFNSSRGSGVMPPQNHSGFHAHHQLTWEAPSTRRLSGEWLDGTQSPRVQQSARRGSATDTAGPMLYSTQQGELPIYGSLAAKLGKTGQRAMDYSMSSRSSMMRTPPPQFAVTHSAEASPDRIIADVLHRKKAAQTAARPFSAVTPRNSLPMHKRTNDGRRRSPDTDPGGAPLGKGSQRMSFIAANVYSIDLNALSPVSGTSGQRRSSSRASSAFDGNSPSCNSTRRGSTVNASGGVQGLRTT